MLAHGEQVVHHPLGLRKHRRVEALQHKGFLCLPFHQIGAVDVAVAQGAHSLHRMAARKGGRDLYQLLVVVGVQGGHRQPSRSGS